MTGQIEEEEEEEKEEEKKKKKKKKKKKRHTRNPLTLAYRWNAFVNVQLHILDDPHSVHLKNATTRTTTYNRVENTTEDVVSNEDARND